MQSVCLLFAGRRGLENQQTRQAILRIPEVSRRIAQAQKVIDQLTETTNQSDLYSFILLNDNEFNSHKNLKSLATAIVQVGLFDRLSKYRSQPQYLIGLTNEFSALKVCSGQLTFPEFIAQSDYCKEVQLLNTIPLHPTQLLGLSLEEYCVYNLNSQNEYNFLDLNTKDSSRIIEKLLHDHANLQCIHIGPNCDFRLKEFENINLQGLSSMNSIDLDPILSSFWKTA